MRADELDRISSVHMTKEETIDDAVAEQALDGLRVVRGEFRRNGERHVLDLPEPRLEIDDRDAGSEIVRRVRAGAVVHAREPGQAGG